MKKNNDMNLDRLINRVISETLEEKADKLSSKIKRGRRIPTDDEVDEMMSSEVNEKTETCEQCGGGLKEGEQCEQCSRETNEGMGKLNNAPTEFDYVAEDIDFEDDEEEMEENKEFCKYQLEKFGPDDERYIEKCKGKSAVKDLVRRPMNMNEKLHGGQKRLDKNKNGRIDSEDFKMLRKREEKEEQLYEVTFETDEGNAFTEKLKNTKKGGTFELDGKKYKDTSSLEEGEKFIKKATEKIEKKGTEGKFSAWCKRNGLASEDGEVTKKCIDKGMKSENPSVVKMANFAKNIKGFSGSEHKKKSIKLKESEVIDLIERIIMQEQKSNIKQGSPRGLEKYKQVHNKDGKENSDALKATAKKMKEYLKDGSKGNYETNPDFFPKGNGELSKMSKKAYVPSGAVKDYVDNFTAASLENLDYDGINPNEEWVTDNIEGSSRTGNNPEWANTGKSDVNKKRNKIRKDNMLAKLKRKAYNKAPQPIVNDKTGEDEGDKIMTKLESIEPKNAQKINEEFDRIKSLMSYNQKTQ